MPASVRSYGAAKAGVGHLVRWFVADPVNAGLKVVGSIIIIEAMLSALGELLHISAIQYGVDPLEYAAMIFLGWILLSRDISKLVVGIFLVAVFAASILFLIVPLDAVAELMQRSLVVPGSTVEQLNVSQQFIVYLLDGLRFFLDRGAVFVYALLMGALGSSIVITRQFIRDYESMNAAWYVYRLIQGMIMALLVIYGLAAGMLSLGAKEPILGKNFEDIKYFIGFVSALSGLFSEQAFLKLQEVSKTLFGAAGPVEQAGPGDGHQT